MIRASSRKRERERERKGEYIAIKHCVSTLQGTDVIGLIGVSSDVHERRVGRVEVNRQGKGSCVVGESVPGRCIVGVLAFNLTAQFH